MSKPKRRRIHCCGCAICQQHPYSSVAGQHRAINRILATLDEKNRRRLVGLLALQWGRGSISPLSRITGLSRMTIRHGKHEVEHPPKSTGRIREPGAGRPRVEKNSRVFWPR